MSKLKYRYDHGYSIEILGFDKAIGGIRCAVMRGGQSRFDGSPYQCLKFLAAMGGEGAKQHLQLFEAAMKGQGNGRSVYN